MIFLPNQAFSNLHNLYIGYIETVNLLYMDHKVFVWHYHNSENPYHPSNRDMLALGAHGVPRGLSLIHI